MTTTLPKQTNKQSKTQKFTTAFIHTLMCWVYIQIIITSRFEASFYIPAINTEAIFSFQSELFFPHKLICFVSYISYYRKGFLHQTMYCTMCEILPLPLLFVSELSTSVRDNNKKRNLLKLISFNFSISFLAFYDNF